MEIALNQAIVGQGDKQNYSIYGKLKLIGSQSQALVGGKLGIGGWIPFVIVGMEEKFL